MAGFFHRFDCVPLREERVCWNEKIAMGRRKRILFLAEGATMTHFVRPVALADSLVSESTEYDLYLYAPARFAHHLAHKPYSTGELKTMPGEVFLANIARGKTLFPADVLRRYVKEDRDLIRNIQPDLVVGDMRPSLPISARLEKAPCAVLINAYWSPYAKRRAIIPELPLTRVIPPRWLGPVYRAFGPIASALHVAQMNRVRREFGIAALPLDSRRMFADGDYVLYADVPEFVPTDRAPPNHHYVGICNWSPPIPKPEWWERMCEDPKPKVFVSLGSSGPVRVLPELLAALARLPVSLVLSTSGRQVPALGIRRLYGQSAAVHRDGRALGRGRIAWRQRRPLSRDGGRNAGARHPQQRRSATLHGGAGGKRRWSRRLGGRRHL